MKKAILILVFVASATGAFAQNSFMSWQYSIGFGSGDLHDFVGKTSFRGATYNYSKLVNDGVALGLEIGWNAFYEEKADALYNRGNFDFYGKQYRYSNQVPLLFTISYFPMYDDDLTPFVSLGIGTMYSEDRVTMGTWDIYRDAWPFTLKPELGVQIQTGGLGFSLSTKYYYGFKTNDLPAQSFFTINFGFVFTN
jgi:hypothetical protein